MAKKKNGSHQVLTYEIGGGVFFIKSMEDYNKRFKPLHERIRHGQPLWDNPAHQKRNAGNNHSSGENGRRINTCGSTSTNTDNKESNEHSIKS